MYQSPFSSPETSSVLRAGWRYRRPVLLAVALGLAAGLLYGLTRDDLVSVARTVVLRDPSTVDRTLPARDQSGAYERYVRSQALFAGSDEVLAAVAATFDVSLDRVRSDVDIEARSSGEVLRFAARGPDEGTARALLVTVLDEYRAARGALIERDALIVSDVIDEMAAGLDLDALATVNVIGVESEITTRVYDDGIAFEGEETVSSTSGLIRVGVPVAVGFLVATMAALAVAAMVNERRPLVLGPHTLVDRHQIPIRAVIPSRPTDRPLAFRHLGADLERSMREHARPDKSALLTLVVGVDLAADDVRLVLVEAIRNLTQSGHRIAMVSGEANQDAEQILTEGTAVEAFTRSFAVETELLAMAGGGEVIGIRPAYGRRALPEYAGDPAFEAYVRSLRDRFDLVVFDCPPLQTSSNARRIARLCDEAILVVPYGASLLAVDDTVRTISQAGTPVTGYIVNGEVPSAPIRRRSIR